MIDTLSHEQAAREYLTREWGPDAPTVLTPVATYNEKALESEGEVTIFSFTASRGDNTPEPFHVVAGETEPNYYPDWGLVPDDIYSLHLGTRFMVVLQIAQLPLRDLPESLEADVEAGLARVAPGEPISGFRPVAAFTMEGQPHAVCRLRIAEEEVYVVAGELPLGICRRIDLPPHVVYRLHLGKVIRLEERDTDE